MSRSTRSSPTTPTTWSGSRPTWATTRAVDTEGAQYDIVLSSDPADWSDVQRLVLEYHPVDGHSWDELQTFFSKAGLEVAHLELGLFTDRLGTAWLSRTPLPAL